MLTTIISIIILVFMLRKKFWHLFFVSDRSRYSFEATVNYIRIIHKDRKTRKLPSHTYAVNKKNPAVATLKAHCPHPYQVYNRYFNIIGSFRTFCPPFLSVFMFCCKDKRKRFSIILSFFIIAEKLNIVKL